MEAVKNSTPQTLGSSACRPSQEVVSNGSCLAWEVLHTNILDFRIRSLRNVPEGGSGEKMGVSGPADGPGGQKVVYRHCSCNFEAHHHFTH